MCIQTRICLVFDSVVVGSKSRDTVRCVGGKFKSWVVNNALYNIQTDIILELKMQIRYHFQLTVGCPVNY